MRLKIRLITFVLKEQQLMTTTSNLSKNSPPKLDKLPTKDTLVYTPTALLNQINTTKHQQNNKPLSTPTGTMGLNSFNESQQTSAIVFPSYKLSSGGIKKFANNASSVTTLSSTNVKLPTPASTIFLQN